MEVRPPAILLESGYGRQEAVQGSYCIEYEDPASGQSQGQCGDSAPVDPKEATAVTVGDKVSFELAGAQIVSAGGCHSDDPQGCIGSVTVRPLGCEERRVAVVPLALGKRTDWVVDLEPGAYQLDVFAYFESDEGATGDASGTLGLTVAGAEKRDALRVTAVKPSMQVCKPD